MECFEKNRKSKIKQRLACFHAKEDIEVLRIGKCIHNFESMYKEYVEQHKYKELEHASPSPPQENKRRMSQASSSVTWSIVTLQKKDEVITPLVSYEDLEDEGSTRVVNVLSKMN